MAKETFSSEEKKLFNKIASGIFKKYGIIIHLAEIRGNRWSYVSGKRLKEFSCEAIERIKINEGKGIVLYNNIIRDANKESEIKGFLKAIIQKLK
ncbi:MAG: hypothetical protein ABIH09_03085 [Candidatus Omnitrophota bacterium]